MLTRRGDSDIFPAVTTLMLPTPIEAKRVTIAGRFGDRRFYPFAGLPITQSERVAALHSPLVCSIEIFALGPAGTNIAQATESWIYQVGVADKAKMKLVETPEAAVAEALALRADGVLAVFVTCAVYTGENAIFFKNPETLPFFFQFESPLDQMQIATRMDVLSGISRLDKAVVTIASHPSPVPLIINTNFLVRFARSNADAARICAAAETDFCITTDTARSLHGLSTVLNFGSPTMLFLGGITRDGAELLREACSEGDE